VRPAGRRTPSGRGHQSRWATYSLRVALAALDHFDAPDSDKPRCSASRVLRLDGRRSVEQIVDAYGIECRPVRDLLVEYLTERSPELDHTSLRSVARNLCRLFWRDLEIHHPGIDSLRLAPEVARAWKERLAHIRDADGSRWDPG
jgi:hypothetical protein